MCIYILLLLVNKKECIIYMGLGSKRRMKMVGNWAQKFIPKGVIMVLVLLMLPITNGASRVHLYHLPIHQNNGFLFFFFCLSTILRKHNEYSCMNIWIFIIHHSHARASTEKPPPSWYQPQTQSSSMVATRVTSPPQSLT